MCKITNKEEIYKYSNIVIITNEYYSYSIVST